MKKLISMLLVLCILMLLFAGCSGDSSGNDSGSEDWPNKPLTFIVTHGAGGDTDYNARLMSRMLEDELGVAVAVNNVTGSNGAIALTQYKDENPDGYTFVFTNTAALTGNEATGISDFGFDAFEPVSVYGRQSGENIIVPADSPYENLDQLIEASKANPGSIRFGVSTGGGVYIASVILEQAGGSKFQVIESGDAAERVTSLLGGHVDATIAPYSTVKEYIENGDVKALSTLLEEPPTLIPDIPSASETLEELKLNTYYVALAPKGTDSEIVEKLNDAILKIVNENQEYSEEVERYNLQAPWALSVSDSIEELSQQRDRFMRYSEFLR